MDTSGKIDGPIKFIIGLGNPGKQFERTRHNVGFSIVDTLAREYGGVWESKNNMETAQIELDGKKILLIKPQTFMNNSGDVIPFLQKMGIKPENFLVVHDELEIPFGTIKIKIGGSARGHNGVRSIIERIGDSFARVRFGIDRPKDREEVSDYVLSKFKQSPDELNAAIDDAVQYIVDQVL